ncbi:hypothetical protein L6164_005339 [Bauhinia variegata]|uniref:Uncharacterized protein n=1 Tax=Bauhinia variegata TaxID=167791 RepID=A0ACB9PQA4_BAUVA|nr:hypothetical protein L6164_005339 [Bauhinia variegata]
MAAKRFFDDSDPDPDKPNDKRMRPNSSRPSFASVIGEAVMVKNLQNLFSGLEPLLRKVVNEELERAMRHYCPLSITRSPSLRIQAMEQPPSLQLAFSKKLSLPIFTGSRILAVDGNPITIILVDKNSDQMVPTSLPHPIKLQIVVLDGDFPAGDDERWTSEQFNRNIIKERTGKRPLLTGELNITLRDGIAPLEDIGFTDNSSWIRSRKFRVAVRVATGSTQGVRIREGMTGAFMVKDHRGELYKKHHPPMLHDEVWRLEKIAKDGAFHKKLSEEGIKTVQEFLKLSVVDPNKLRKALGVGMSDKMWDATMKHAKTCDMGNKLYVHRGSNCTLLLNPVCQVIRAEINGQIVPTKELQSNMNRSYVQGLVRDAYMRWTTLEEVDAVLNDNMTLALLTQGESMDQYPNNNNNQSLMVAYEQNGYYVDKSPIEMTGYEPGSGSGSGSGSGNEWPMNSTYASTSAFGNDIAYSFSESQSDGDINPSNRWN